METEDWARLMYAQHPKQRDKILFEQAFVDWRVKYTEEQTALLCRIHTEWSCTEDWRKEGGRWAPNLYTWLKDCGYWRWPDGRLTEFAPKLPQYLEAVKPEAPEMDNSLRPAWLLIHPATKDMTDEEFQVWINSEIDRQIAELDEKIKRSNRVGDE